MTEVEFKDTACLKVGLSTKNEKEKSSREERGLPYRWPGN